jgi:hypothetical protein
MTGAAPLAVGEALPAPYAGRRIVLATRHAKEQAVTPAVRDILGAELLVPDDLDTDALGTFSGEIERQGTMGEVAVRKARLGMAATGLGVGLASEGSFGPHPQIPMLAVGMELMVLVDDERGLTVTESLIDEKPCFGHFTAAPADDIARFLRGFDFPAQGLIVGPNRSAHKMPVAKGIRERGALEAAIVSAARASDDGKALVETDMRAHMNPTRMAALGRLAEQLAARLNSLCPGCAAPGFGLVDTETGLPCEWCRGPSVMVRHQIFGCAGCDYRETRSRPDGLRYADPGRCQLCNP